LNTYKEIQQYLRRRAKQTRVPEAFDHLGFRVAGLSSGPAKFNRQPGMILKYSDGKHYQVQGDGSQRRVK